MKLSRDALAEQARRARARRARRLARRDRRAGGRLWLQLARRRSRALAAPARALLRAALLGGLLGGVGGARAADLPEDTRRGDAPRLQRRRRHRLRAGAAGAQEHRRQGLARPARTTSTRSATPRSTSSRPPARTSETRARVRPRRRLRLPRLADHARRQRPATSPTTPPTRVSLDISQEVFGGMTTVIARLHARRRQGRQEGLARVLRHAPSTGSTGSA